MEKEIKVRKRRFAAFWTAVLLLCGMVLPMVTYATDYTYTESGTAGDIVQPGDTISIQGTFEVYYDGSPAETVENTHTVQPCTEKKAGQAFSGWKVTNIYVSSGVTGSVSLEAQWISNVIDAGNTYELKKNQEYQLGSATRVDGDSSTYYSGSVFYVPADGSYTFK